ncbi:thioesterase-like superfamily protein [Sarocladium implicatum]|nr:thioesterase-like superfamily protein [Sarocladium implicatum]
MSLDQTPACLSEAARISRLDSHAYGAHLRYAYFPNGGYVASTFLRAAREHLTSRKQTDTISAHFQFVNKTSVGPAVLIVDDTKLGRGVTVLHITLYQEGLLQQHPWVTSKSIRAATAYITNGNISTEKGVNLPTGWTLGPKPPPAVDLTKLPGGEDPNWAEWIPFLKPKIQSLQNIDLYIPRAGHPLAATHDVWTRLANGDRWFQDDLGFVLDIGPPLLVESFRPPKGEDRTAEGGYAYNASLWYPTISASLETKKRLPEEGVEWVRFRVECKSIKNGRFDAEVMIFDTEGDLVALSHHVALAVGAERNRKSKGKTDEKL